MEERVGIVNNFICVFIVKRDKRMRDARRYCGASACVSVPTSVPILESDGAHRIVLTMVNTVTQPVEN
jgi:hypothetical protein